MFSLRAILLAAAACAMIASAIPMPGHDEAPGPEPILDSVLENFGDIGGVLGHDIFPAETTDEAIKAAGGHVRRGDLYNPSDSFQKCSSGIALVIVKIKSACGGDSSKVDHNVVIGLLREILALLGTLLFELKGGDYKGCDVNVLSGLLAGLLITLAEVIALVIGVVGSLDKVLCGVIADIAALLCVILRLVFGLVDGLLVAVVILLVSPFSDNCQKGGLLVVLQILDIKV